MSVQRGYLRPADDVRPAKAKGSKGDGSAPLSEKLVAELTASRTAAPLTVVHSLAGSIFYGFHGAKPNVAEIADRFDFDMATHWQPIPQNYLARVSKDRLREAVRAGVSKEAADNLAGLKKEALAAAAAERLAGKGWLPTVLRNDASVAEAA